MARQSARGAIVAVADGAGGLPGGARAAELAIQAVEGSSADVGFDSFDSAHWLDLLRRVDRAIEQDALAGETTLVVVAATLDGRLCGASAGDSGAWVIGHDGTIDDLTAEQQRKRLGTGRAQPIPFARSPWRGCMLAATDGLLSFASSEVIVRTLQRHRNLGGAALALIEAVRSPRGLLPDDVTVALLRRP